MKRLNVTGLSLLLLLLLACGGGESSNSEEFERQDEEFPEPETLQRIYRGDFVSVNPEVRVKVNGQVILRLVEDRFEARIAIQDVPNSLHPQSVLTGEKCPDLSADLNRDGILSFEEAQAVSGTLFIPLDRDLDSNTDNGDYPKSDFINAYVYEESTDRADLKAQLSEDFNLADRVVMIYGSGDDRSLPIACAELSQITGSR